MQHPVWYPGTYPGPIPWEQKSTQMQSIQSTRRARRTLRLTRGGAALASLGTKGFPQARSLVAGRAGWVLVCDPIAVSSMRPSAPSMSSRA